MLAVSMAEPEVIRSWILINMVNTNTESKCELYFKDDQPVMWMNPFQYKIAFILY